MPFVSVPDVGLHYVEQGGGEAKLVFVHGYLSSHRWWLPTLSRLPDRFHAFAVDLRGAGESEATESGHTLAQYAEDLYALARELQLPPFTLVGHSMGGQVALQVALTHPELLKGLVLVSPVAASGNKLPAEVLDWCRAEYGKPETVRTILGGAFAIPPPADYFEELVADGQRWGRTMYLAALDEMVRFDVAGRLGEIRLPTLVTWGDRDVAVPFPGIAELFEGIPGCGLEIWHGVGHSAPIEAPDRFVALLIAFVDENAGAGVGDVSESRAGDGTGFG